MEIKVHNKLEAKVLVKEWNARGEVKAKEISFFKHESEEYIGRVFWASDYQGYVWEE